MTEDISSTGRKISSQILKARSSLYFGKTTLGSSIRGKNPVAHHGKFIFQNLTSRQKRTLHHMNKIKKKKKIIYTKRHLEPASSGGTCL